MKNLFNGQWTWRSFVTNFYLSSINKFPKLRKKNLKLVRQKGFNQKKPWQHSFCPFYNSSQIDFTWILTNFTQFYCLVLSFLFVISSEHVVNYVKAIKSLFGERQTRSFCINMGVMLVSHDCNLVESRKEFDEQDCR